nr:hypothetical protein Iba_chr12bCG15980 [Ipomoea batatas]
MEPGTTATLCFVAALPCSLAELLHLAEPIADHCLTLLRSVPSSSLQTIGKESSVACPLPPTARNNREEKEEGARRVEASSLNTVLVTAAGAPGLPHGGRRGERGRAQREVAPRLTEPPAPPSATAKTTMDQLADANTGEVEDTARAHGTAVTVICFRKVIATPIAAAKPPARSPLPMPLTALVAAAHH